MTSRKISCGIDVGTNSIRLVIADFSEGRMNVLYSEKNITRLGENLFNTGMLADEAIKRTLQVLAKYKNKIDEYSTQCINAVATSAVREAGNGALFVAKVNEIGIPLKAIDGFKEAQYTYCGVRLLYPNIEQGIIYDIGGGSTELIFIKEREIIFTKSIPFGVVKLSDQFGFNKPVNKSTIDACGEYISAMLDKSIDKKYIIDYQKYGDIFMVGVAGAVTSIAEVLLSLNEYSPEHVRNCVLDTQSLDKLIANLMPLTQDEKRNVKGVREGREDLMIPGAVTVLKIMEFCGLTSSKISDYGLVEGITFASIS